MDQAVFWIVIGALFTGRGIGLVQGSERDRRQFQSGVSQKYLLTFLRRYGAGKIILSIPVLFCGLLRLLVPWGGWSVIAVIFIVVQTVYFELLQLSYTKKS